MKFYGIGGTIVWDKENDKALCQFVDGELETKDKRIIDLLTKAGYRSDDVGRETEQGNEEGQEVEEEPTFPELRKQAKKASIEGYGKMNKASLIKALKEGD